MFTAGDPLIQIFTWMAATVSLDQWSKGIARHLDERCISFGRVLRLKYAPNNQKRYIRRSARVSLMLSWALALFSAVALFRYFGWFHSGVSVCGLGLAFGGATGNLWDILHRRFVIDFIDLHWWPLFNLADVAIVAGLALAFLGQT
jgi:lipoprotein signal peptidase